jgi:hypothetical protein
MSIPRLVSARLHPKKPIDLIANGIQPSGWTYPILTDESRGLIPGFDLPAEHFGLEACAGHHHDRIRIRAPDGRSQVTANAGKSVAFHILELLALQRS